MSYMWLGVLYIDDYRHFNKTGHPVSRYFARGVMLVMDEVPFYKLGTFFLLGVMGHCLLPLLFHGCLMGLAAFGAMQAYALLAPTCVALRTR